MINCRCHLMDNSCKVHMYNTKEVIHINAKQSGLRPWALGCSCDECNREFDKLIDDNLSDTQQENKMSVKELKLEEKGNGWLREIVFTKNCQAIEIAAHGHDGSVFIDIDRSQAHLLMLYLQEHLNDTK